MIYTTTHIVFAMLYGWVIGIVTGYLLRLLREMRNKKQSDMNSGRDG